MRLVTIQPYEVLEILNAQGRFVCYGPKCENVSGEYSFAPAYQWLAKEMVKRIGPAPTGVAYPIWAWYKSDDDFADWGPEGEKYAKLTVDIDPSRVVLSDFDDWHCVLNCSPLLTDEEAESDFDANWDRYEAEGPEAVEATWQRIFHSDRDYVQATFWELLLSDIVEVEVFTCVKSEESE